MESETMFIGMGMLVVLYFIYDVLKGSTAKQPKRAIQDGTRNQEQPPPPTAVNFKGNFDSESLNKARAIVGALGNYPDDLSKSMALADLLHREKRREYREPEQRREPGLNSEALLDGFSRLFERVAGRNRSSQSPYDTDFMDRGNNDYPPQRRTRRIDGYPPYNQDNYPLRPRDGRWE